VLTERRAIDPEAKKMWRLAATTGAIGIEIAIAIALPTTFGLYLDRKFGTKWIMYVGLAIGLGAAVKALVRVTRQYKRAVDDGDSGPRKN
jgi:F0F1-type ATP synthase assembly protein I